MEKLERLNRKLHLEKILVYWNIQKCKVNLKRTLKTLKASSQCDGSI